jgi:hypothetical protein
MFQDLDSTLAKLLTDPAAPPELAASDVNFETPDKNFAPAQPTVDLFLYEVKENRDLRDPTPILQKVGETFTRLPPPVRIDCSYIVTAWSNAVGAAKVSAEHQLLFEALQWLTRFPTIPAVYLQGSLVNPIYPPPTMVAQLDPNKHAGDFWYALGIPPRPAFYLTVTIEMVLNESIASGALVTTRSTIAGPDGVPPTENWVQIGGQVVAAASPAGVAGAVVDLVDLGLRTTTGTDGRYTFLRVPLGTHSLRAVAVGFRPLVQPVNVPGNLNEYDLTLISL